MSVRLELKVPPVLLVVLTALAMWLSAFALPWFSIAPAYRVPVASAILLAGLWITVMGVSSFRAARTTVNPLDPGSAQSLVTTGVYRWTRNPMYVGFLLVLTAWAVWLSNVISIAWIASFAWYLQRFQIVPEERALRSKFGAKFDAYCRKVRRWL
jgi:protein-S-isoprenylcysteine O-methyltransferase Ste14